MAKNRKTVLKPFTYLQCDDFADYLSAMAAKGWHFKEWGIGLVFEKGEPEQAVYAVEVFIHGSDYDLRPDDHTLNFSDYCKEAGWELIDAKQKYCIFKQLRPDAVPIVTEQERLENAAKAYRSQLIWQVALALLWVCNMLLRIVPVSQRIETFFSPIDLMFILIWSLYFLFITGKCIWYLFWMRKARKACDAGQTRLLHLSDNAFETIFGIFMIASMAVGFVAAGESSLLVLVFISVGVLLLLFLVLAKVRPSRETNIGIQVTIPIVWIFIIILSAIFIFATPKTNEPNVNDYPLVYEDLQDAPGELQNALSTTSSSIFGSSGKYALRYDGFSIDYDVYKTDHEWILDTIWDYHLSLPRNSEREDCTTLWGAQQAYQNQVVDYYVRFDNAILILRVYDYMEITDKEVAIIIEKLGLEG